jgi:mono/diheme cytochrome c family protein
MIRSLSRFSVVLAAAIVSYGIAGMVAFSQESKKTGEEEWKAPARAAKKKNPVPADAKSIARGKAVYFRECQACHGDTGRGDGPKAREIEKHPGNLTDPKMWDQTDGALFWKTTEGKKPMPTYDKLLKEDERWDVVNYTRTLAPKKKEDSKPGSK